MSAPITLTLVGIGTGNPQHLTLQAIEALNAADVILIPRKGAKKDDLAGLRREICAQVLREPGPEGERRATIYTPGETTRMAVAVQTCRMGEDDDFVLDVMSCVLANGKSSRLFREMVLDRQLVTEVATFNEPRLDPGAFWFTFELSPGVVPETVEECLREQLQAVERDGFTEPELRRARTQLESAFLFEEETALDSAMKIGRWDAQSHGGYRRLADVERLYDAVDSAAVQRVAASHFSPKVWNVAVSLPRTQDSPREAAVEAAVESVDG